MSGEGEQNKDAEAPAEEILPGPEPVPQAPADDEPEPEIDWRAERVQRADAFVSRAKDAVSAALAAQPHRGAPNFTDLTVVAHAIIDALAAEMKG